MCSSEMYAEDNHFICANIWRLLYIMYCSCGIIILCMHCICTVYTLFRYRCRKTQNFDQICGFFPCQHFWHICLKNTPIGALFMLKLVSNCWNFCWKLHISLGLQSELCKQYIDEICVRTDCPRIRLISAVLLCGGLQGSLCTEKKNASHRGYHRHGPFRSDKY